MSPTVDLVIVFQASGPTLSKQQKVENAQKAESQYSSLLQTLKNAGLFAVGRSGEKEGTVLILISCSPSNLSRLIHRERHSDFLFGLPTSSLPSAASEFDAEPLVPADRIRILHSYLTATEADGGLGIGPDTDGYSCVQSVTALHDPEFNEQWVRSWKTSDLASTQLENIRNHLGDSVALYFAFLSSYTRALVFPAALGVLFYFFGSAYSVVYSTLLVLWAVTFSEWWRVYERVLSVRWGTRGAFMTEKRRANYAKISWFQRDLRVLSSVPIITFFAGILAVLLTSIFVFEAFVTQLYTGPGSKYVSIAPTILFSALVPRVLGLYQIWAQRFTRWENHAHQSKHAASLAVKTFALSALVAYSGLALSAFVYVPFGETVMALVQTWIFTEAPEAAMHAEQKPESNGIWEPNALHAKQKINPSRLQNQMFAFTVTNQIIGSFLELGLPFILRAVEEYRTGKKSTKSGNKKRVMFEDETLEARDEREFLDRVRSEVALPNYDTFFDYSEMVTQFGYVALWSSIWSLAPVAALINNLLEIRGDAFKITVHHRRPIPSRTDTVGPWLDMLSFLTWLAALTNAALVYLFNPRDQSKGGGTVLDTEHEHVIGDQSPSALLISALLIALAASHGYMVLQVVVRHLVERVVWKGSVEVEEAEEAERQVKQEFLKSVGMKVEDSSEKLNTQADAGVDAAFWGREEGIQEFQKMMKLA